MRGAWRVAKIKQIERVSLQTPYNLKILKG